MGAARVRGGHSLVGACYGFCVRVWGACSLGARVLDWVLGGLLEGVSCCEGGVGVRAWPTPGALLALSWDSPGRLLVRPWPNPGALLAHSWCAIGALLAHSGS